MATNLISSAKWDFHCLELTKNVSVYFIYFFATDYISLQLKHHEALLGQGRRSGGA